MKKIELNASMTVAEGFEDFVLNKKSSGLAEKTLTSYRQHFHAISKYLDIEKDIAMLEKYDLDCMIIQMRDKGLAAKSTVGF